MTFIHARISPDEARRRIEHRWWHRFTRRGDTPLLDGQGIPRLELVCLPYYLITLETTLDGTCHEAVATVEGYSGTFALFDRSQVSDEPDGQRPCFRPRLEEDEAVQIARNWLQVALLRSRGRRRKARVGDVRRVDLLQYPYWVYYYHRRKQRLDIKVLDAVTGGAPGPKIKTSLLAAFIAARRTT